MPDTKTRGARFDLLSEPLIGVELEKGRREAFSLPEVLELLGNDDVRAFTALQAHQQHAWHAFLVQLAAIALHQAGQDQVRQRAEVWREILLALTKNRVEPWCLVVDDLGLPALFQPPVPERTLEEFSPVPTPDELDLLVTAKNHDVKRARVGRPRPEHWLFALVSLQTMEGFGGRANYGIARMNGGYASRPGVSLVPSLEVGPRFQRDTAVLLQSREEVAGERTRRTGGIALLWLEPWDGKKALAVADLDPFFIEVCRRIRFTGEDKIEALSATSTSPRINAKELKGNLGDPWTPVDRVEAKAFTATASGFDYRTTQDLLVGKNWAPGAALVPRRGEKHMQFLATVLSRGMGETNGHHERAVPLPDQVLSRLCKPEARDALGEIARARVEVVAIVKTSVLKPAVLVLLQGDPPALKFKDERAQRWLDELDGRIDAVFFGRLWADLDRDPGAADRDWAQLVLDLARSVLRVAVEDAPIPSVRRYRAIASAERVFEAAARKRVAQAFDEREGDHAVRS